MITERGLPRDAFTIEHEDYARSLRFEGPASPMDSLARLFALGMPPFRPAALPGTWVLVGMSRLSGSFEAWTVPIATCMTRRAFDQEAVIPRCIGSSRSRSRLDT